MGNIRLNMNATPESVLAILEETAEISKENERRIKELRESQKETDRQMKENRQEIDRIIKETAEMQKETARQMKNLNKEVSGMGNSQGLFAEEYFFNSFEKGEKNFFGEKFDDVNKNLKNVWKGIVDEYDIVLYNHASVAIIEVKYKAEVKDIPQVLKKAETFRILFPHYKDFKIYLGLASLSFSDELEEKCINEGIAVIKQVGDKVVINDNNLKVF